MYLRARQYGISYLPQEPSIFRKLSVEENILAVLEAQQLNQAQRRTRTENLIEQLNLGHVRKTRGYALSGGERRRVEIARCLAIEPAFILLDEPFSGIDPIAVLELQEIIFGLKKNGIGVLITDHNVPETLTVADRAYIINEGRIFRAGTPRELGRDPEVKRHLPGRTILDGLDSTRLDLGLSREGGIAGPGPSELNRLKAIVSLCPARRPHPARRRSPRVDWAC